MDKNHDTLTPDHTDHDRLPGDQQVDDEQLDPQDERLDDPEDENNEDEVSGDSLPDWVYEEVVGRLFRMAPENCLKLLGIQATGPVEQLPMPGPENPPSVGIQLYRLPDGGSAEVYCVREVPKDLVATMAWHRAAVRHSHPVDDFTQYVVVTEDGEVRQHDEPVHTGVYFDLRLLYLRDIEREWFATSPDFARLGRCQAAPWASEILKPSGISAEPFVIPPNPSADLFTEVDAKQADLPVRLTSLFFDGRFGVVPDVPPEARHLGWAGAVGTALAIHTITRFEEMRGRIGHREGIADVLGDVLRERFGEHVDLSLLAYRLAALTDLDAVIQIINTTDDLDTLYAKYLER